jgi:hypothetical protein
MRPGPLNHIKQQRLSPVKELSSGRRELAIKQARLSEEFSEQSSANGNTTLCTISVGFLTVARITLLSARQLRSWMPRKRAGSENIAPASAHYQGDSRQGRDANQGPRLASTPGH